MNDRPKGVVSPTIRIGERRIGSGCPVYVVAELSANHRQDYDLAVDTIIAAKASGADAIKLQTYTADTMTIDCDNEYFQVKGTPWEGETLHSLYLKAYTPWEWHAGLQSIAKDNGLDFLSTPFDGTAVDLLESLNVPVYKVASFETGDIPLLRQVARTGKPVILSTGMASLGEIEEAVSALRDSGCQEIVLLKCTSAYPASPENANLRTIPHLSQAFNVPVGLSDHTLGLAGAVAAVALGACVIEKHFTLSRDSPSPDSAFSMEPEEFVTMVKAIRETEASLGQVSYSLSDDERKMRTYRRSLFVVQDVKAGEVFTEANVRCIRPAHGLHPRHLDGVMGMKASCDVDRGTPLRWDLVGDGRS